MTLKKTPVGKVLVVEDDPELNQAYRDVLSAHFHVIAVQSGSGAAAIVRTMKSIDLIMLDYVLPDMSGLDVFHEIKKILPSVPVILITGHGTEDLAIQSFREGVADYFKKPFRYDRLISRMKSLISQGRKLSGKTVETEDPGCAETAPSSYSPYHIPKIQRVVRHIDDNYMTNIDLAEAARIACMSPCHFSRLFRKTHGIGFKEHMHRKRIRKASELLRDPALSVVEVALAVGYADLTHFERIFKKAIRSTPSEYRTYLTKEPSF